MTPQTISSLLSDIKAGKITAYDAANTLGTELSERALKPRAVKRFSGWGKDAYARRKPKLLPGAHTKAEMKESEQSDDTANNVCYSELLEASAGTAAMVAKHLEQHLGSDGFHVMPRASYAGASVFHPQMSSAAKACSVLKKGGHQCGPIHKIGEMYRFHVDALKRAKSVKESEELEEAEGAFKKHAEFVSSDGKYAFRAGRNTTNQTWDHRAYEKKGNSWKHIKDFGYDGYDSKQDATDAAKQNHKEYEKNPHDIRKTYGYSEAEVRSHTMYIHHAPGTRLPSDLHSAVSKAGGSVVHNASGKSVVSVPNRSDYNSIYKAADAHKDVGMVSHGPVRIRNESLDEAAKPFANPAFARTKTKKFNKLVGLRVPDFSGKISRTAVPKLTASAQLEGFKIQADQMGHDYLLEDFGLKPVDIIIVSEGASAVSAIRVGDMENMATAESVESVVTKLDKAVPEPCTVYALESDGALLKLVTYAAK